MNAGDQDYAEWSGDKCTGAGCPLAEKCARHDKVMSKRHYLEPPYNRHLNGCKVFFHKRYLAKPKSLDKR